jgi:hypothetical protein
MRVRLATASANKTPTGLPFQDVTLAKESVETENAVEALDQGKVLFLRVGNVLANLSGDDTPQACFG